MTAPAMPKFLTSNFFWIVLTVGLVLFAFSLFFGWGLMVGTLFLLFWIFRWAGWEAKLSLRHRWLYLMTLLIYPIAETSVQWLGINGLIPKDFTWVNRLEHMCWAIALTLLFAPLISQIWQRLNRWQNLLFIVGFVCFLGNLNEFFEYIQRVQNSPINQAVFARYYVDTIYDMLMNLLGSLIGFVFLSWFDRSENKLPEGKQF